MDDIDGLLAAFEKIIAEEESSAETAAEGSSADEDALAAEFMKKLNDLLSQKK